MMGIKRHEERVDVAGRIDAVLRRGDQSPPIQVMNLNHSGAALRADEPVADVLERAALSMRPVDGGEWVECACEVRYILGENRPDGAPAWLHGVRFLELPEPTQAFISRLLTGCP